METLAWAGVETLNSVFNVNKAFEKLSKQKIPFTPEETEQILGQTASVLNKLNEKKLELDNEDLQVPEEKLKDIIIKLDLGKFYKKLWKFVKNAKSRKNEKFWQKPKKSRKTKFRNFNPTFFAKIGKNREKCENRKNGKSKKFSIETTWFLTSETP